MRAVPALVLALSLTACLIPVRNTGSSGTGTGTASSSSSSYGSGGSYGADGADGTAYAGATPAAANTAAPAAPQPVYVTIRSACSKTVPVFYGDKPRYSSGTTSSVSSNSVSSQSFSVGDMMWILDDSGDGVGSVTISQNTREIEINSSCGGLSAR
jgi:hypothetical protein